MNVVRMIARVLPNPGRAAKVALEMPGHGGTPPTLVFFRAVGRRIPSPPSSGEWHGTVQQGVARLLGKPLFRLQISDNPYRPFNKKPNPDAVYPTGRFTQPSTTP